MLFLDVLYISLATIAVMILLQIVTFVGAKLMYPPEPKIIYRDVVVPSAMPSSMPPSAMPPPAMPSAMPPPAMIPPNVPYQPPPSFGNGNKQEVVLPEYEPAASTNGGGGQAIGTTTTSARVDSKLPPGLQSVNPRDL